MRKQKTAISAVILLFSLGAPDKWPPRNFEQFKLPGRIKMSHYV